MVHINHRIGIQAPIQKVYDALATADGIANWWTKDTSGISEIGKNIEVKFHSPDGSVVGSMTIEILALQKDKKVHWKFSDGPAEWIGTEVIFDIHQEENYTIILFQHRNWAEEVEFKAHCSMKWAVFLLSFKQYVETSTGKPSPLDLKIDNWN